MSGLAVATYFLTQSVVHDQERRLLRERAGEVALTLTSAVNSLESSLNTVASVSRLTGYSRPEFEHAAAPLLAGPGQMVGIARQRGAAITTIVAAGHAAAAGRELAGPRAALIERALTTSKLVSAVISDPGGTHFDAALRGPGGTAIYEESAIDPRRPIPSPPGSPYSELTAMLYASPRADPAQLVITTTADRELTGMVDRRVLHVGADDWLLLTGSRTPLVGSFASEMPSLLLAAVLLAALVTAAFVELLARRRRYAFTLVEERTIELRQTLDRQVLLEQEHRQAKEAAEQANRAKNEFLSRMSHELRTPLNAILGFGQLLELDELTERQRENVAYIMKGGAHLLELINEVLDLARIESGQLTLSPEPVPLAATLHDALSLVAPLATARGITVSADTSAVAQDAHVQADRQRLKQVLLNLLSNAIKYNRPDGRVEVSLASPGEGRTSISVADTGIGIGREQLANVFEPFERLGAEHSEIEGTGLGLALSKRLIEAMGGSIAIDSEPGRGTVATLELDAVQAPAFEEDGVVDRVPDAVNGHRARPRQVLYVEDNLSNLTLVERILEREPGIELVPAMQGTLGLELARQHHPKLIMLDLHLPDMSGEEVLRRLKADPETSQIPVVVLSADASKGRIGRLLECGAVDYLTKPLNVQRLLEVISANVLEPQRVSSSRHPPLPTPAADPPAR